MKKQFIFSLLFAMAGVLFAGCERTPDDGVLKINTDALETFAWKGGKQDILFFSSYGWSATSSADWCTISPQSGFGGSAKITVTVDENVESSRTATITISSTGQQKTVEVNQEDSWITTVKIPATTVEGFLMGTNITDPEKPHYYAPRGDYNFSTAESPVHQVVLSAFRMGIYEVTNAQYATFLNAADIEFESDYGTDGTNKLVYDSPQQSSMDRGITYKDGQWVPVTGYENHPVIYVTWYGAKAFCDWLSEETGHTWRLPTEAEWEYACRGGSETAWFFGRAAADLGNYAWFDVNSSGTTHAVGQKEANPYGLYDIYGNVDEWCSDWYKGTYYNDIPDGGWNNPTGPQEGSLRVKRGGNCSQVPAYSRSAHRNSRFPGEKDSQTGFRVVLELP